MHEGMITQSRSLPPAIPLEELVEAEIVYATGIGDETLSNANPFKSLPLVGLRNNNQISYLGPLNGQYR